MGYTLIALFTDLLFEQYKPELERIEGKEIKQPADILRVKESMF